MRTRVRFGWILVLALVLTIGVQSVGPSVRAEDLQEQLNKAQQDLDEARRKQGEIRNALADVEFQAEEAEAQLRMVEGELVQANNQLAIIEEQRKSASVELEKVQVELAESQKKYEAKKLVLGARLRAIRENGRVDYLAVLFGATSFGDFIGRLDTLGLIVKKDKELFEGIKADKLALEQRQKEVTSRKSRLDALKAQSEARITTIASKRSEREQVSRSLQSNRRSLEARLNEYDSHADMLAQKIADIVRQMNRQGGKFAPIPPVRQPYIITDAYGMRDHPILGGRRMHWGTDFNAYTGQQVYAIEAGVVISARWDDVFGNLVIIDHGGGITSWYAHNSRFLISVNQTVTQGQPLAEAGSTGWSTGPHVHLEVHVNGERKDPMSFIGR